MVNPGARCHACGEPMQPTSRCSALLCLNPSCWVDSNPKASTEVAATDMCQRNGCEAEARQSVILGWGRYHACPEHYGEMLAVLGVD